MTPDDSKRSSEELAHVVVQSTVEKLRAAGHEITLVPLDGSVLQLDVARAAFRRIDRLMRGAPTPGALQVRTLAREGLRALGEGS
jgi:hypothetical protein